MTKVKPHAMKSTFWNAERIKRGWSIDDISAKLNIPKSTLGRWFSGNSAPRNDSQIHALCNLFEVDFDTGYNEFYREERNWDAHVTNKFWNELRRNNKLTLKDISEITNIPVPTLSTYFTGRIIPNEKVLETLCNLFGVDKEKGYAEFVAANKEYHKNITNSTETVATEEVTATSEASDACDKDDSYNFWPDLVKQNSFSYHDLSVYLNVPEAKVAKYFSGEVIPNFNQIRMLCGLYGGVDLVHGSDAFKALHDRYNNGGSIKITSSDESPKVDNAPRTDESLDIFEIIYQSGKLSYKEFLEVYKLVADKKEKEILKLLYNQLSFDEYYSISKVLADWCK